MIRLFVVPLGKMAVKAVTHAYIGDYNLVKPMEVYKQNIEIPMCLAVLAISSTKKSCDLSTSSCYGQNVKLKCFTVKYPIVRSILEDVLRASS